MFAGAHIRRLRRQEGLTQTKMADQLGISTSYLNLIERNQRPVTAQMLLRLADSYDLDIKGLTGDEEMRAAHQLKEILADPLFRDLGVGTQDLIDVAAASPSLAQAVARLYAAYREANASATEIAGQVAEREKAMALDSMRFPIDQIRDFFHAEQNHFSELETAAEALWEDVLRGMGHGVDVELALRDHLNRVFGVTVEVAPYDIMAGSARLYDRQDRRLLLSELLLQEGRTFSLAYQLALLGYNHLLDGIIARSGFSGQETPALLRVGLANYFAGAVLMPYSEFVSGAEALRYDLEILARRFRASFEQVCHRLTTLQRPGARGVPFFMLRVDQAGNVSKRFSAGGFPFARFGGTCPRWNVHDAFHTPGRIYTQMVQLPDGTTYFSIARTVEGWGSGHRQPKAQLAIGLGCEVSHARRLVYADGYDIEQLQWATPIGVNCRLCERTDCNQRAFPPLGKRLVVNENVRGVSPFAFAAEAGKSSTEP